MAQPNQPHLAQPGNRSRFAGLSHLEIDLGRRNTLLVGFDRFDQVLARQNVDSVLRLFVQDYRRIEDTTQVGVLNTYALLRLSDTDRRLELRQTPEPAASFLFRSTDEPVQLKTGQDTLRMVWEDAGAVQQRDDFAIYLLVNSLNDVERLLADGGVDARLRQAIASVRAYKAHDLTHPRMSFNYVQEIGKEPKFIHPGLAKSPFLSFNPNVGVGLIQGHWVPSLNLDIQFVPSRFSNVAYSIGYLSNFFFQNVGPDGPGRIERNDFLNVGVMFYRFNPNRRTAAFDRVLTGFQVGIPIHRTGRYFSRNTIRLSGIAYQKGLVKVQPELYMNGFFRKVYPGVRISFGL